VLQRVREGGNESDIVRRLPGEVGISLRAGKTEDEEELQGPRAALRRNPAPARAIAPEPACGASDQPVIVERSVGLLHYGLTVRPKSRAPAPD
jgi:hypothetical protein